MNAVSIILACLLLSQAQVDRPPRMPGGPGRAMSIFEDCAREGRRAAQSETLPDGRLTAAGQALYDAAYKRCLEETHGYRPPEPQTQPEPRK